MIRALAYRRTLYEAGPVLVCIGRRSRTAEAWMARRSLREAGFITAWNPMSRVMPASWNAAAMARLRRDARTWPARLGQGALGDWREEMLLVGAEGRTLLRLARQYRQAAIVLLRRGSPASLTWTSRAAGRC